MAKNISSSPLVRNTFVTVALLALVVIFLGLNYLYFIPKQKSLYNKKVFRILHEQVRDLNEKITAYAVSYSKSASNDAARKPLHWMPAFKDDSVFTKAIKTSLIAPLQKAASCKDTCIPKFNVDSVQFIKYCLTNPSVAPVVVDTKLLGELIEPIQAMHQDVFDYVVLIDSHSCPTNKFDDTVLYKSSSLAMENTIQLDSFFKKSALHFSTLADIDIEGTSYKLFLTPFNMGNATLLLGGFIESAKYKTDMNDSSYFSFIIIGSLLILIIIWLPFLKVYFLSDRESININDVRLMMVSLLVGPFLFTLAIAAIWLYAMGDQKTDELLVSLHKNVKKNFKNEIDSAVKQLHYYDAILDTPLKSNAYANAVNLSDTSAVYYKPKSKYLSLQDSFLFPVYYKALDDISWINNQGKQIAKWSFRDTSIAYLDLNQREYVKDIKSGHLYTSTSGNPFVIQPTLSWSTGEYTINIATPSKQSFNTNNSADDSLNAMMVHLSASMYSVCNPVLPKGFNFCIADKSGNILFHSQTSRAIHENIFEETNNNEDLHKAIDNDSKKRIIGVQLYDHDVKLYVTPIEGMRYYLITYYNVREQNLFVLHIVAFSFLSETILLFLLLIFLLTYYFLNIKKYKLPFQTVDTGWMRPSADKANFYASLLSSQFIIIAGMLAVLIFIWTCFHEQVYWYTLQVGIWLPFIATACYYITRNFLHVSASNQNNNSFHYAQLKENAKLITIYLIAVFAYLFIRKICLYDDESKVYKLSDWLIILLVLLLPFIQYCMLCHKKNIKFFERKERYLFSYCMAIFMVITIEGIFPTFCFLNYALKEEKNLQLKARQIYFANEMDAKAVEINELAAKTKIIHYAGLNRTNSYLDNLAYAQNFGVYMLNGRVTDRAEIIDKTTSSFENFHLYNIVTRFLFLPKDHLDFFNNTPNYQWQKKDKDSLLLEYYKPDYLPNQPFLQIVSPLPLQSIFGQLFSTYLGWALIAIMVLFAVLTFRLIRSLCSKVFLLGYFKETNLIPINTGWLDTLFALVKLKNNDTIFGNNLTITYQFLIDKEKELVNESNNELLFLRIDYLLSPTYNYIWQTLSPVEQFVLYDFAKDGFTNYKNMHVLFSLYQKGLIRLLDNDRLIIMNYSFRNFLLMKGMTEEVLKLQKQIGKTSIWKNIKNIFFGTFILVIIYLLITQQDVSNKIIAIVSGLVTLLPLMLKLFNTTTFKGSDKTD